VSDYLESDGVSRQVEVRSGHDGSKKAEAEEDMEGDSSSTELLRRCFALLAVDLCSAIGSLSQDLWTIFLKISRFTVVFSSQL
jgi:hypothetical protein